MNAPSSEASGVSSYSTTPAGAASSPIRDGAALGGEHLHQVPDPQDAFGVEPVDRLVEQQDLRVTEHGHGHAEPLAHAEREAPYPEPACTVDRHKRYPVRHARPTPAAGGCQHDTGCGGT
jgi:hypothetical protein